MRLRNLVPDWANLSYNVLIKSVGSEDCFLQIINCLLQLIYLVCQFLACWRHAIGHQIPRYI